MLPGCTRVPRAVQLLLVPPLGPIPEAQWTPRSETTSWSTVQEPSFASFRASKPAPLLPLEAGSEEGELRAVQREDKGWMKPGAAGMLQMLRMPCIRWSGSHQTLLLMMKRRSRAQQKAVPACLNFEERKASRPLVMRQARTLHIGLLPCDLFLPLQLPSICTIRTDIVPYALTSSMLSPHVFQDLQARPGYPPRP